MKKRLFVIGLCVAMSATMFTGCGKQEKYENDIEELHDMMDTVDNFETEDNIKKLQEAVDSMKMKTSEGKELKEKFTNFSDLMGDVMESINDRDIEKAQKYSEDAEKMQDELDKALKEFKDAAKESGVDEEKFKDLDVK